MVKVKELKAKQIISINRTYPGFGEPDRILNRKLPLPKKNTTYIFGAFVDEHYSPSGWGSMHRQANRLWVFRDDYTHPGHRQLGCHFGITEKRIKTALKIGGPMRADLLDPYSIKNYLKLGFAVTEEKKVHKYYGKEEEFTVYRHPGRQEVKIFNDEDIAMLVLEIDSIRRAIGYPGEPNSDVIRADFEPILKKALNVAMPELMHLASK